ncbi:MAG: polyprenyl diphosphate synthase [Bdellovibrionota bacterium]|nr:polyprenyl diphosphate synthase [Bdellovibrionota bacterium]
MKAVRRTIEKSVEIGLEYLSLFTLSNENWQRPQAEVSVLMKILRKFLKSEIKFLVKNNIRLTSVGDLSRFPEDIQKLISEVKLITKDNTGLVLCLALSYGSQQEIVRAALQLASDLVEKPELAQSIDVDSFSNYLDTNSMPNPDLIIRTSGETRLSNFMLFQAAYSELYFTNTLWPDFTGEDLIEAITKFESKERRFGKTSEQISKTIKQYLQG